MIALVGTTSKDLPGYAAAQRVLVELNATPSFVAACNLAARDPFTFVAMGGDAALCQPFTTREVLLPGLCGVTLYRSELVRRLLSQKRLNASRTIDWWKPSKRQGQPCFQVVIARGDLFFAADAVRVADPVGAR